MKEQFKKIVEEVLREQFGGCDPRSDTVCCLRARVLDNFIEVFVVGKWRCMKQYYPKNKTPSKKIMDQIERSIRLNTGATFKDKLITFIWE